MAQQTTPEEHVDGRLDRQVGADPLVDGARDLPDPGRIPRIAGRLGHLLLEDALLHHEKCRVEDHHRDGGHHRGHRRDHRPEQSLEVDLAEQVVAERGPRRLRLDPEEDGDPLDPGQKGPLVLGGMRHRTVGIGDQEVQDADQTGRDDQHGHGVAGLDGQAGAQDRDSQKELGQAEDDVRHQDAEGEGDEYVPSDVEHPADDQGEEGSVDDRLKSGVHSRGSIHAEERAVKVPGGRGPRRAPGRSKGRRELPLRARPRSPICLRHERSNAARGAPPGVLLSPPGRDVARPGPAGGRRPRARSRHAVPERPRLRREGRGRLRTLRRPRPGQHDRACRPRRVHPARRRGGRHGHPWRRAGAHAGAHRRALAHHAARAPGGRGDLRGHRVPEPHRRRQRPGHADARLHLGARHGRTGLRPQARHRLRHRGRSAHLPVGGHDHPDRRAR